MANWKQVYTTSEPYKAEIVKDVLENNGIQPIIVNKKGYLNNLGHCEVLVVQDKVLFAMKIIDDEIQFK